MKIGTEGMIIVSTLVLISFLSYTTFYEDSLQSVKSTIDNQEYLVQDKEDAEGAANLIATIRQKLIVLVEHLIKTTPNDDERIVMLIDNFKPDNIKEGVDNSGYTSYSVNKGEQIVLCLRSKNKLMDINTMMFVVLHELAHIVTKDIGHPPEFWQNFKWILEESINVGIYQKTNYSRESVEYCGMTISSSPLD
jgi:predicted metal-dependent hydrolase